MAHLAGQWGQDRFYAGGDLHAASARLGHVRLTLADGTELTADAGADIALFISDRPEPPAKVDIYDLDGRLLASHKAF